MKRFGGVRDGVLSGIGFVLGKIGGQFGLGHGWYMGHTWMDIGP